MAFTPRTETYVNVSSLTTPFNITVTKPTGTVDGDILFCWIGWYAATTIDSVPAGWSLLGEYVANTDRYALYYKIASGEGANWVWSFAATAKVRAVCSCYTSGDFDRANPIDVVSNTAYRTSNNSCLAASMNVSAVNSPLIFWGGVYSTASRTFTKPSVPTAGWVEDDDAGSTTPDFWTEVCSMIWAGSGATGNMTATISSTGTTKHAFAVALKLKAFANLAGVVNGIADVVGVIKPTRRIAGIITGVATVSGVAMVSRKIAGAISGIATVVGDLTVTSAETLLAGVVSGVASVTGTVKCLRRIAGASDGISSVSGVAKVTRGLSGVVNGIANVTGIAKVSRRIAGVISGISVVTGAAKISKKFAGIVVCAGTAMGSLRVIGGGEMTFPIIGGRHVID